MNEAGLGFHPAAPSASVSASAALSLQHLSKSFGAVSAVRDVSFDVAPGSLTCLIGPNGAGKSTLLHCISGRQRPDEGVVRLDADDLTNLPAHVRARRGLATVFQSTRPLERLDVLANAMLGGHPWTRTEFTAAMLRLPRHFRDERQIRDAAREALARVGLLQRADVLAQALPFGQMRLLAVARALVQRPRVLLLDEPAAGLRGEEKTQLAAVLAGLRDQGLTQILVEHDMQFVRALAERLIVLENGQLIADGLPQEVWRNQQVRAAYFGSEPVT